ncbi:tetratricopeptide repeat protein [Lentzea sp. NPDC051838]|uniref:tetratricopeptide repeat protein n=1 Tax=Lentzea sp. NPDC051838 TaxID=3154849 RepID=UPI00343EDD29
MDDVTTAEQLAAQLRALRRRHARSQNDRELTVREIAAKSGYAVGRISEYLNGVTLPPTDRFDVLIGIFGASDEEQAELATARDRVEEARRVTKRPELTPMQLPPVPHGFEGELELGEEPISVVTGPAGVGKTALVVRWAHRNAGRFPDGVLYLDLRAHHPEPASLLRALGVQPPAAPGEQISLWRTTIARRRVLLVLDDARDAEQVLPLLPGSGSSVVVVTSRNALNELVVTYGAQRFVLVARGRFDAETQARALANLGETHNRAERFADALEVLERARDLYADVEDHAARGDVLASLGACYAGLGRRDEAIAVTYKALALHQAIGNHKAAERAQEQLRTVQDRPQPQET